MEMCPKCLTVGGPAPLSYRSRDIEKKPPFCGLCQGSGKGLIATPGKVPKWKGLDFILKAHHIQFNVAV